MLSRSAAGDVTTFTWDYRNRLTEAKRTTTMTNDVTFTYDLQDRRIAKTVNGTSTGTVYDGANPYADYNGSAWSARYLYGLAVDELFARYVGTTIAWYLSDQLGSVRLLVDGNGNTLDSVTYDSFGNIASETAPSSGDRFKFTGREWDSEILQYGFRARCYLPGAGRFESEDPLNFTAGDANLTRYVGNSPTTKIDPTGQGPPPPPRFYFGPLAHGIQWAISDIDAAAALFPKIDAQIAAVEAAIIRCDKSESKTTKFDFGTPLKEMKDLEFALRVWYAIIGQDFDGIIGDLDYAITKEPLAAKFVKKTLSTRGADVIKSADGLIAKGDATIKKMGRLIATIQNSKCTSIPLAYIAEVKDVKTLLDLNLSEFKGAVIKFGLEYKALLATI
jgi:RHS repeat-associated protein